MSETSDKHRPGRSNGVGPEIPTSPPFEEAWPSIAHAVGTMLRAKKVNASLRDDIVQETGLRLYKLWAEIDPTRGANDLAVTIALNLVRDQARRDSRRATLAAVPDLPGPSDVERQGLARLELGRVKRALHSLSPAQRVVLMAEVGDRPARFDATPGAVKVMRMRARQNLRAILERGAYGLVPRLSELPAVVRAAFAHRPLRTAAAAAGLAGALGLLGGAPSIAPPGPADGSTSRDHPGVESAPAPAPLTSGRDGVALNGLLSNAPANRPTHLASSSASKGQLPKDDDSVVTIATGDGPLTTKIELGTSRGDDPKIFPHARVAIRVDLLEGTEAIAETAPDLFDPLSSALD